MVLHTLDSYIAAILAVLGHLNIFITVGYVTGFTTS